MISVLYGRGVGDLAKLLQYFICLAEVSFAAYQIFFEVPLIVPKNANWLKPRLPRVREVKKDERGLFTGCHSGGALPTPFSRSSNRETVISLYCKRHFFPDKGL